MNRLVAIQAQPNGDVHLLTRKVLAKPLVAVAGPRDQMMFVAAFGDAIAEATRLVV